MPLWSGLHVGGPSAQFPHSLAMVDDMVHQRCSYIIRSKGSCMASATLSSSASSSSNSYSLSPSAHACKVLEIAKLTAFCSWLIGIQFSSGFRSVYGVVAVTWCVLYFGYFCFPYGTLRVHFWTEFLMYEIDCSIQNQVCCIKEWVCCRFATRVQSNTLV